MVIALGIPLDENSSFLRGSKSAPANVREAYHSPSSNFCTEDGIDLSKDNRWKDAGDLELSPMPNAFKEIETGIEKYLQGDHKVLSIGGDHSITYPVIKAFSKKYRNLNILHIDAHADLYDVLEGDKFSHACPFARIMEAGLAKRLVQVGIRTLNAHQREQADRFGVEIIEMKNWRDSTQLSFDGPLYISLDLDALDPAFVPGVSHYEPGGFTPRQVLSVIQSIESEIVGADIVELNPVRDINNMTAMLAAKFYKELIAKLLG